MIILKAGFGLIALLGCNHVYAQPAQNERLVNSEAFLGGHPDLRLRRDGLVSYRAHNFEVAMERFKKAARYADKPSQVMISQMFRKGEGVARDPARSYAWMDLAAERGYRFLLVQREKLWTELSSDQRRAALKLGREIYKEYGDEVAQPRLAAILRRTAHRVTGSRAGFVGTVNIYEYKYGSQLDFLASGEEFYASQYWNPKEYWHWQNREWRRAGDGTVDVGPMEQVKP